MKKYIGLTIMAIALVYRGLILIFLYTPVAALLTAGEWLTDYGDALSGTVKPFEDSFERQDNNALGPNWKRLSKDEIQDRVKRVTKRGPGYIRD